jgi:thiamine biosynthesis lipoprotein
VTAETCLVANTASTACIVLGDRAEGWLVARGLAARLVGEDGEVVAIGDWPAEGPECLTG